MTLDQLKVLEAIVEYGSFRAAAESLHRAQSAVSYAIRNLETELEISIFNRDGYRPKLTDAGKTIFKKSKSLLMQADELAKLGVHLSQGKEAEIKLAINGICPFDKVIQVINQFSAEHPSVRLILSIENLGGSVEQILDGQADIALSESLVWNENLFTVLWDRIKFLPVAAPDFFTASPDRMLDQSDLLKYPQIIVADSSRHSDKKTIGVLNDGIHWTVNDFSIKRRLLVAGSGWGMMPQHMIQSDIDENRLVQLDYQSLSTMEIDFFLLRRKDTILGPISQDLWNSLAELQTE